MHFKSAVMLRVLANRFLSGSLETSLAALPEDEAKEVTNLAIEANDPSIVFLDPSLHLSLIHYSWFVPLLKKQYKEGQQLMLTCFPEHHASRLMHLLKINIQEEPVAPLVKSYLAQVLLKNLTGALKVIPREFLPKSPLTPLAFCSKNELVELIDCLGIHDLAYELKLVLDQRKLKMVYGCLSPREQQYLRTCMHLKEKVAASGMGIDRWNGDCEKLKIVLQTRGLTRLAKAISGESQDLVWHIAHTLDIGRGQALIKNYTKDPAVEIKQPLIQQVHTIMNLIKS